MIDEIAFWSFQILNSLGALGMLLDPKRTHESMIQDGSGPEKVYRELGFSETAVEMVHNLIRGHGAALLAISSSLFYLGSKNPGSLVLIGSTCYCHCIAHTFTARHHITNKKVKDVLGKNINHILVIIGINFSVGSTAWIAWYLRK